MTAFARSTGLPTEAAQWRTQAEAHLKARRWSDAAACLAQVTPRDPATQLKLNLAGNLACLQRCRPAVYDVLLATPAKGEYQVAATPLGKLSVMHRDTGVLMCATHDPPAAAEEQVSRIAAPLDAGQAAGLFGLGDGHLLAAVMKRACKSDTGMTNAVLVFEPSVDAVTACLMLHDWTGSDGPIQAERVHWFVGPAWQDVYRRAVFIDLYLPTPQACLATGPAGQAIHADVQAVVSELKAYDDRLRAQVQAYYAGLSSEALLARLHGQGQTPRVLITTSRFTTVLRYAAADAAEALARLGWDVRLSIEERDWQRTSVVALRKHVADHKPDLVLVIDHLRHEYGDLYPLQLPYACWIQDDLSRLTTRQAGESIGVRDFVLTISPAMYQTHYGYPARQCLTTTKLTRPPVGPRLAISSGGPDIVYVSHAGKPRQTLLADLRELFREARQVIPLVEACAARVIQCYDRGGCIHTMGQMVALVNEVERETDMRLNHAEARDGIVRRLMHPLNNALYRQQALQWIVTAAGELGASFELYGQGWAGHEGFAEFARGPVAYGEPLQDLTRRAAVSLHIVPYFYLHQRLLDGLVAGGFFLMREHPSDSWRFRWNAFINDRVPPDVDTLAAARAALGDADRAVLDKLVAESHDASLVYGFDTLARHRRYHAEGMAFLFEDLPRRAEVSFTDAAGAKSLLQRYLNDADARSTIAREQRAWVEKHYTYEAGLLRAVDRIRTLIAAE